MIRSIRITTLTVALTVLLSACTATVTPRDDAPSKGATLEAEVFYREKLMLPPGCVLTVSLENVSTVGAPPLLIAEEIVTVQAAPPFKVSLGYDPAAVHDRLTYAIRARIEFEGQLFFISGTHTDPFATPEGTPVKILVRQPMRLR